MPRVAARVLPGAVLGAVVMVLLSAASVYAKGDPDNPNGTHDGLFDNPGHHYGQLKHSQAPTPAPTPAPTQAPGTPSPAATQPPPGPRQRPPARATIPSLRPTLWGHSLGQLRLAEPLSARDGFWWLLLLILPLLLAIWVLVVTRLAVALVRRLRRGEPVPQMAPART